MSGVTDNLGLILPDEGEAYDLDTLIANYEEIDKSALIIDYANSTLQNANWNFDDCRFTRLRVGNLGVVICELVISVKAVTAVPANTASAIEIANVIPVGFVGLSTAATFETSTTANGGATNRGVQAGLKHSIRGFQIRSDGATFNTTVGTTITLNIPYRWDGNL